MKPTSFPPAPLPMPRTGRIVASNTLFWLVLCLVGASGSYSDALRSNADASFLRLFLAWLVDHLPVCALGIALHLVNRRWPACFASGPRVLAGYGLVLVLFLPPSLVFIEAHEIVTETGYLDVDSVWPRVLDMQRFTWFTEWAWTSGTYIAVVALCVWRRQREQERAWIQAERDNLGLRLQILRGQLEPHFMFNALNAISALVRADDRPLALAGIRRLSDLLRYAVAASEREWVTLADELRFTRDYLALQRLRHGERLQVVVEGDDADVLCADCPPLLLQPLVENALRHGLERHAGQATIGIALAAHDGMLSIRISNPLVPDAPPNPGAGTGLKNLRARLDTAYRGAAQLRAGGEGDVDGDGGGEAGEVDCKGGRFVAEIRMPLHGADAYAFAPVEAA